MGDTNRYQLALAWAGFSPTHSKVWADFMLDQSYTPENFTKINAERLPLGEIDADLLRISNLPEVNKTLLFFISKTFAAKLVPDPESIDNWDQFINLLRPHIHLVSRKTKSTLANIETNETFQKRLAYTPRARRFADWKDMASCGELFDTFMISVSFMHRNRGIDTPLVRAYFKMLHRLKGKLDSTAVLVEPDIPKMVITVHSRFRGDLVVPLGKQFGDSLYSVLAGSLLTTQHVNAQRILMLKKLKRGTSVMIAADGKKGSHNAKGLIFDRDINVSDGFAWVAWKANCPVLWAYAARSDQGSGLTAHSRVLQKAPGPDTDFETYAARVVAAYLTAVEDAIIRHPFSFGLLYPRRIGDLRPAVPS